MLKIENQNLCELCFAKLPPKMKKCPYCGGEKNLIKYPTSLPEGTILVGRYSVGKVLGKGGFGITYLCYDLKENKKVAIKEYLPDTLAHRNSGETAVTTYDGEQQEFFKNGANKFFEEAKLVSRFNGNPNIISVHEFFYENNTTYFVMEYLSGMDMKRYLQQKKGKIPESEALYIANRVTEALLVVHSTGIYHRDISPDNIFLCDNGDVKLIDFGAARQVVANVSNSLSVIIKHGFAPLEQYQRRGKQGPWTDIYALGATIYLAVTGNMPDDAMSRLDDDSLDFDGVTPEFADILEHMLKVDREDRYQEIFLVKKDLNSLNIELTPPNIPQKVEKNFCTECGAEISSDESLCDKCKRSSSSGIGSHKKDRTEDPSKKRKINISLVGAISAVALVLFFVVVVFSLAVVVFSQDSVSWTLNDGILTIYGQGPMKDLELSKDAPWYDDMDQITTVIVEYGVTSIADWAFSSYPGLTSVSIADSVTSIGNWAFYHCDSLTDITIPDSVTSIGERAFSNCSSLTSITIPYGVSIIDDYAFYNCSRLESVTIPDSVTSIDDFAFSFCSYLTNIFIPESVTNIGNSAFYYSGLKTVTIPVSVTNIGDRAFLSCFGIEEITVENDEKNVSVGEDAFPSDATVIYRNSRASAETDSENIAEQFEQDGITWSFSDGVLTVSAEGPIKNYRKDETPWVEYKNDIHTVIINWGVTQIGDHAFYDCKNLVSLSMPKTVTRIGKYAFYGCSSLSDFSIPEGVKTIDESSFDLCPSVTKLSIPSSVTEIGKSAFYHCFDLKFVTIENSKDNVTIGSFAFPSVTTVSYTKRVPFTFTFDDGVLTVSGEGPMPDYYTYGQTKSPWYNDMPKVTELIIEEGITSIGNYAFSNGFLLESISIPDSVTNIGNSAFSGASLLVEVTIPSSVISIGEYAFDCPNLETVTIENSEGNVDISYRSFPEYTNVIYTD